MSELRQKMAIVARTQQSSSQLSHTTSHRDRHHSPHRPQSYALRESGVNATEICRSTSTVTPHRLISQRTRRHRSCRIHTAVVASEFNLFPCRTSFTCAHVPMVHGHGHGHVHVHVLHRLRMRQSLLPACCSIVYTTTSVPCCHAL